MHMDKSLTGGVSPASRAEDVLQKEEPNNESLKDRVRNIWAIISCLKILLVSTK